MKEIVAAEAMNNESWGYCHTRGLLETREFICELTNSRHGAQITPEDIIFFNGLGDAIAKFTAVWIRTPEFLSPRLPTRRIHWPSQPIQAPSRSVTALKLKITGSLTWKRCRRQIEETAA